MSIADSLREVQQRVAEAARRSGREPNAVQLLAVSKLKPDSSIREAYAAGQRDFGENYAQELRDKGQSLADLTDLRLHAIGPLQRNKVKYVAQSAASFHALDRLEIAEELDRRCRERGRGALPCFIEVAMAPEEHKSGVAPGEVMALAAGVARLGGLRLAGLMCIPPAADDAEKVRPYFAQLRELSVQLQRQHPDARGLSMGMSADFEVAIQEGATVVRVGTTIFGAR